MGAKSFVLGVAVAFIVVLVLVNVFPGVAGWMGLVRTKYVTEVYTRTIPLEIRFVPFTTVTTTKTVPIATVIKTVMMTRTIFGRAEVIKIVNRTFEYRTVTITVTIPHIKDVATITTRWGGRVVPVYVQNGNGFSLIGETYFGERPAYALFIKYPLLLHGCENKVTILNFTTIVEVPKEGVKILRINSHEEFKKLVNYVVYNAKEIYIAGAVNAFPADSEIWREAAKNAEIKVVMVSLKAYLYDFWEDLFKEFSPESEAGVAMHTQPMAGYGIFRHYYDRVLSKFAFELMDAEAFSKLGFKVYYCLSVEPLDRVLSLLSVRAVLVTDKYVLIVLRNYHDEHDGGIVILGTREWWNRYVESVAKILNEDIHPPAFACGVYPGGVFPTPEDFRKMGKQLLDSLIAAALDYYKHAKEKGG